MKNISYDIISCIKLSLFLLFWVTGFKPCEIENLQMVSWSWYLSWYFPFDTYILFSPRYIFNEILTVLPDNQITMTPSLTSFLSYENLKPCVSSNSLKILLLGERERVLRRQTKSANIRTTNDYKRKDPLYYFYFYWSYIYEEEKTYLFFFRQSWVG